MVSSVSSLNSLNCYNISSNINISSSTNNTQEIEDSYTPSINLKDLFDYLASTNNGINVNSLEEYINSRGSANCKTQSELQSEFQEYMKYRGCDNESELKALNSANANNANDFYPTKQYLIFKANLCFLSTDSTLEYNGFTSTVVPENERNSIFSTANLQDIADYVNSCDRNQSATNEMASYKKFLSKVVSNGTDLSDALKSRISTILQNMTDNSNIIDAFTDEIDKEAEAEMALDDARRAAQNAAILDSSISQPTTVNMQKYNSTLIANYQS